jgi:FkbM family methyltransferase
MPSALFHIHGLTRAIGLLATAQVLTRRVLGVRKPIPALVGRGDSMGAQIVLRPSESDLFVASQIFGWEDYKLDARIIAALQRTARHWTSEGIRPIILDGGANVGYSSIYFAEAYPNATVLAVEPDLETFRFLQINTKGLDNVRCVHGALWCDDGGVDLHHAPEGSWATKSVAATTGTTRTPSYRIDQVTNQICNSRVLILKLDIEGAERQACASSPGIVASTPCVIVEPHDFLNSGAGALSAIYNAFAGKEVDTYIKGENLVFVDSVLLRKEST